MTLHLHAETVARHLCALSQDGCPGSEQFPVADIESFLGMKADDMSMALDELEEEGLIVWPQELGGRSHLVQLEWLLFFRLDEDVKGWAMEDDARAVARAVADAPHASVKSVDLASQLGWSKRRLNPATHYRVEQEVLDARSPMTKRGFYYPNLTATSKTQRFLRDEA